MGVREVAERLFTMSPYPGYPAVMASDTALFRKRVVLHHALSQSVVLLQQLPNIAGETSVSISYIHNTPIEFNQHSTDQ